MAPETECDCINDLQKRSVVAFEEYTSSMIRSAPSSSVLISGSRPSRGTRLNRERALRRFEDVFLDELQQYESNLNIERYCEEGGFPDPESIEMEIGDVTVEADGSCGVTVSCAFDEVVATGCSDISFHHKRFGKFTVLLDPESDSVDIDYLSLADDQ